MVTPQHCGYFPGSRVPGRYLYRTVACGVYGRLHGSGRCTHAIRRQAAAVVARYSSSSQSASPSLRGRRGQPSSARPGRPRLLRSRSLGAM